MTYQIQFEEPPENTPPELAAWLQRQIFAIQEGLEQRLDLNNEISLDQKPLDGMLRYLESGPEGPGFYGRVNGVWIRFGISGDVLIGYYDQIANIVNGGPYDGQPLPLATDPSLDNRQYMILEVNGAYTTTNPNLNGLTGSIGNTIRVFDGVWEQEDIGSAYLSSVIDDTANGNITLAQTPSQPGHAAQLGQVTQVQSNLNTHAALKADPNDPHETKTYTDARITVLADASVNTFTAAAYGGIAQRSGPAMPQIEAVYNTLTFNEEMLTTPRGVDQDFANNGLRFNSEGVFYFQVSFTITHDEAQEAREFFVRIYNSTAASPGAAIPIGVGKNVGVTNFSKGILFDIPLATVGDLIQLQVGGGDDIAVLVWDAIDMTAFSVSEFRGNLV